MRQLFLIAFAIGALCSATAAETASTETINKSGCAITITGPDDICVNQTKPYTVKIIGQSDITCTVSVEGAGGTATISAGKTAYSCPDDGEFTLTGNTAGRVNIKVTWSGGGTKVVKSVAVLTDVVGAWTVVRDPNPTLPNPNPLRQRYDSGWVNVPPGFASLGYQKRVTGDFVSTFSLDRQTTNWKPSAQGTPCNGTATVTHQSSFSWETSAALSLTVGGYGVELEVSTTVSYTVESSLTTETTIGEANSDRRWRAYPVIPMADLAFVGTAYTRLSPNPIFRVNSAPVTRNLGRSAIAGSDWHTESACCTAN